MTGGASKANPGHSPAPNAWSEPDRNLAQCARHPRSTPPRRREHPEITRACSGVLSGGPPNCTQRMDPLDMRLSIGGGVELDVLSLVLALVLEVRTTSGRLCETVCA